MTADPVRAMYERYPYPFPAARPDGDLHGENLFAFLERETGAAGFEGVAFLDAGCGTGHRILNMARAYPAARFHAFDFCARSIGIAREQARRDGVANVTFHVGDMLHYDPGERFDFVVANGCLHHLPQPALAIGNLSRLLREDGLLVAWLYHPYGELDRLLQRDALLALLGDDRNDMEKAVELLRSTGLSISLTRYGASFGSAPLSAEEHLSKDVDAFLHPQVTAMEFLEAMKLLSAPPLEWAAIEQVNWEGHGFLLHVGDGPRHALWTLDMRPRLGEVGTRYFRRLGVKERLRVIERLVRPTGFTVFAGARPALERIGRRTRDGVLFRGELAS